MNNLNKLAQKWRAAGGHFEQAADELERAIGQAPQGVPETAVEVLAEMRAQDDANYEHYSQIKQWADRLERALSARAAVPEGFVLVPREATGKMLAEARKRGRGLEECWAIMVSLAPAAPQPAHKCPQCNDTGEGYLPDGDGPYLCNACDKGDAPQPAGEVGTRHDLVPGVMRCAKCAFQLHRVTLYVRSGTTGAGDSATEPCPNGCGPLWPVTWRQWAEEAQEYAQRLQGELDALKAEPAPSAPSPGDALSLHGAAGRSASRAPADVEALAESVYRTANQFDAHRKGLPSEWEDWADEVSRELRDHVAAARRLSGAQQADRDGVIYAELDRAVAKFPTWPTHALHAIAVVNEEVGELNKAILQAVYEPHKSGPDEVRSEAIQAAAMAIRFVRSLGVYMYSPGEQHAQQAKDGAA